jgi:hypothetical protein
MTVKVRIKRPLFQSSQSKYGTRKFSHAAPVGDRTFLDTLVERADSQQIEALRNQQVERVPIADRIRDEVPAAQVNPGPKPNTITGQVTASHLCPGEKEPSSPPPRPGALVRALSWLQRRAALRVTKQLRVSETVSLGEKRFVAIIQVEDRKFLIGGGASNVALLTQLGVSTEPASIPVASIPVAAPLPRLRGVY